MAGDTLYLDTSAWMKLYVPEPESTLVERLIAQSTRCTSHQITYVEMRAAFAKAWRMGRIDQAQKAAAIARFETDWRTCEVMDATELMIRRAGDLADRFGLRGYDSVHLAAAEAISLLLMPQRLTFVCFDDRLNEAATASGLTLGE
jgi:uncharacterized protein